MTTTTTTAKYTKDAHWYRSRQSIFGDDLLENLESLFASNPVETMTDPSIFQTAVMRGASLADVQFLHSKGCKFDAWTLVNAIEGGCSLECLQFLRENGCPWDDQNVCAMAVCYGHLDCLRFAMEIGCATHDQDLCTLAAQHGQLECLRFAHENGCPWDENTSLQAFLGGSRECLQYAREHGCPCNEEELRANFGAFLRARGVNFETE